jgi:lipopolysaccharide/colanic/teichoic acid biosynthesis glycosyltransferase
MSVHASAKQLEVEQPPVLPRVRGVAAFAKRTLDIAVSLPVLVLLLPVLMVLALLIKLQDKGPAFYRRRVVGLDGSFDALKLRTMRADADELLNKNANLRREFEVNFKLKNDPRVTRLGAALRRTSLDEIPQLWNVLRGDMSLVGPRMISPAELKKYGEDCWIFRAVKPGLTGFWQVEARQPASYQKRVAMDLFYVRNWSFLLDLKILMKTPLRIIRGSGAD